jgi:hypothetical protein
MKTAEEILREYVSFNDVNGSETVELLPLTIVDAMEEYAQQQVNNLYKDDSINCDGDERKALLIDFISWYLNVFMRDPKLTKTKTPIQSIDIFLNSINSL